MADVAFDSSNIGSVAGNTTLSVSITVANNPNRYLLIIINSANSATISSISRDGQTPTAVTSGSVSANSGADNTRIYELPNPNTGTADVAVTLSATTDIIVNVISLYNVRQSNSTTTPRTNSASASGNQRFIGCESFKGGMAFGNLVCGTTASAARTAAAVNGIPKWFAAGALSTATAQTSRTPAAPTGVERGMIEIATCSSENNATHSCSSSGWNFLVQTNSGATWTTSRWWRIFDGTNVDPVISWTGSADANAWRDCYVDAQTTGTPCATIGTVGTGTTSPHTSTGGNTTQDDVLAVYYDTCNANTAMAAETSWTERVDSGSATGPCRRYMASREFATSGTGTGDISEAGGAAAYVQQQLEIYNHDNGDQTEVNEVQALSNFTTFSTYRETGVDGGYHSIGADWTTGTTLFWMGIALTVKPAVSLPVFRRPMRFFTRLAA